MRARWVLQEEVGRGGVTAGQDNRRAGKAFRWWHRGRVSPGSWGRAGWPEAARTSLQLAACGPPVSFPS